MKMIVVINSEGTVEKARFVSDKDVEKEFLEDCRAQSWAGEDDNAPDMDEGTFRSITGAIVCLVTPENSPTELSVPVPTYLSGEGHTGKMVVVGVDIKDGITLSLPREGNETPHDVYIERHGNGWGIFVSPDSIEIKASLKISDSGEVTAEQG